MTVTAKQLPPPPAAPCAVITAIRCGTDPLRQQPPPPPPPPPSRPACAPTPGARARSLLACVGECSSRCPRARNFRDRIASWRVYRSYGIWRGRRRGLGKIRSASLTRRARRGAKARPASSPAAAAAGGPQCGPCVRLGPPEALHQPSRVRYSASLGQQRRCTSPTTRLPGRRRAQSRGQEAACWLRGCPLFSGGSCCECEGPRRPAHRAFARHTVCIVVHAACLPAAAQSPRRAAARMPCEPPARTVGRPALALLCGHQSALA